MSGPRQVPWPVFGDRTHVRVTRPSAHVAWVEIDRPPVNALDRQVRAEIIEVFDVVRDAVGQDLAGDTVRCVVLAAAGRHFCAGADLREKAGLGSSDGERSAADRLTRDVFLAVLDCPVPVIAVVRGAAVGAGWVLAACADVVIAADDAEFALPEIDVGQGGGTSVLLRSVPAQELRLLALTGRRIDATEAYRLGAVVAVHPSAGVAAAALELAGTVASKPPEAARAIKGSFGPVTELSLRTAFDLEQRYTSVLNRSAFAARARQAFLNRSRS